MITVNFYNMTNIVIQITISDRMIPVKIKLGSSKHKTAELTCKTVI